MGRPIYAQLAVVWFVLWFALAVLLPLGPSFIPSSETNSSTTFLTSAGHCKAPSMRTHRVLCVPRSRSWLSPCFHGFYLLLIGRSLHKFKKGQRCPAIGFKGTPRWKNSFQGQDANSLLPASDAAAAHAGPERSLTEQCFLGDFSAGRSAQGLLRGVPQVGALIGVLMKQGILLLRSNLGVPDFRRPHSCGYSAPFSSGAPHCAPKQPAKAGNDQSHESHESHASHLSLSLSFFLSFPSISLCRATIKQLKKTRLRFKAWSMSSKFSSRPSNPKPCRHWTET